MPHVIVKMFPGRTEAQKQALAEALTQAVMTTIGSQRESISVGIEDVPQAEWAAAVKAPDIDAKPGTIYKQFGS